MKDDELRARFDGRGVVEVRLDVSAGVGPRRSVMRWGTR